jgi:hypothetical protein
MRMNFLNPKSGFLVFSFFLLAISPRIDAQTNKIFRAGAVAFDISPTMGV